jgi:hypothetical protein
MVHFESQIFVLGYEFLVINIFSILDLMVQILVLIGFSNFLVWASGFWISIPTTESWFLILGRDS